MKLYGLIGFPLGHSFSRRYFTEKFDREGIADCEYRNFPIESIEEVSRLLSRPELQGFNVTIPYKQQIIPYLSALSDEARAIGAVNCVRLGGASKAVGYVLGELGIPFDSVSRDSNKCRFTYGTLTADAVSDRQLIVNATPLGTYPATEGYPPIPYEGIGPGHFLFDLVYNPPLTEFLRRGAERGAATRNGYDMLVGQAERAWEIWNGKP